MAGSVNKVILIGNLGRDPEIRTFQNGGKIANLRIATSETWRDRNTGERKERTEWHSVAIMHEPLVKVAEQYLRKGSKVYVEGALETRKWQDQSGQERYTTEIVLRPFSGVLTMLDGRGEGSGNQGGGYGGGNQGGYGGGNQGGGFGGGSTQGAHYDQSPEGYGQQGQRGAAAGQGYGAGGRPSAARDFDDEIPFAPEVR